MGRFEKGTLIADRYKITRLIGEGGMCQVFLAYDQRMERHTAIKTIHPQLFNQDKTKEVYQRIRREAILAGRLNHPNIVEVYDVAEWAGSPYIVMEFLTGMSLDLLISKKGSLSLHESVEIIKQVGKGLDFAHCSGVIHRDVKPGNIMILDSGVVKITDFGISKAISSNHTMTQPGQLMGTFSYMAPEQFENSVIDHRVDIYALGVVLFEMLTGIKPFEADTVSHLINQILRHPPPSILAYAPNLPVELEAIIARCLEKQPDSRFQSCEEIVPALSLIETEQHLAMLDIIGIDQQLPAGPEIRDTTVSDVLTPVKSPRQANVELTQKKTQFLTPVPEHKEEASMPSMLEDLPYEASVRPGISKYEWSPNIINLDEESSEIGTSATDGEPIFPSEPTFGGSLVTPVEDEASESGNSAVNTEPTAPSEPTSWGRLVIPIEDEASEIGTSKAEREPTVSSEPTDRGSVISPETRQPLVGTQIGDGKTWPWRMVAIGCGVTALIIVIALKILPENRPMPPDATVSVIEPANAVPIKPITQPVRPTAASTSAAAVPMPSGNMREEPAATASMPELVPASSMPSPLAAVIDKPVLDAKKEQESPIEKNAGGQAVPPPMKESAPVHEVAASASQAKAPEPVPPLAVKDLINSNIERAKGYLSDGDPDRAQEAASEVLKHAPNNQRARDILKKAQEQKATQELLTAARSNAQQGEYEKALEQLETVFKGDPNNAEAIKQRDSIQEIKIAQLLASAQKNADNGDYAKAIGILDEVLWKQPDNTEAKALSKKLKEPLLITHEPPKKITAKMKELRVAVSDNNKAFHTTVYYRMKGEQEFAGQEMTPEGTAYTVQLPLKNLKDGMLEYYFLVKDGANNEHRSDQFMVEVDKEKLFTSPGF